MRVALRVAYEGTGFFGFERQKQGRTVQDELEAALLETYGRPIRVVPAGRTDAGVHAVGQVVHCDVDANVPVEKIPYALNTRLPPDVRVWEAHVVPSEFHARKDAIRKRYVYRFDTRPIRLPFLRTFSAHVPGRLDVERMAEAARYLVGTHDFRAFRNLGSSARTTVRTVFRAEVFARGFDVFFLVEGDGFLYHMVRILAGTLLEVGRNRRTPEDVARLLTSGRREEAGPTAPPEGLWLFHVYYPPHLLPDPPAVQLFDFPEDIR
ncbi:tRNA pseudouridine(38-40) synthase [Brockia lithotrophica]|uniref:tRNA pseudouridine synthase A n=1 Tax=Brockia lithotrophica TaxID=933949 RepID=A0A660KW12_9BACL|nr:tRNA pseudouridine(38-40) synthase [Brockia lithotrophica]